MQDLIESIYEGAVEANPWSAFMGRLLDVYHAQAITLIVDRPTHLETGLLFACNADALDQKKFIREFYNFTPFREIPVNSAVALDDVIVRDEFVHTRDYTDLLRPSQTEYILGMNVAFLADQTALLTVSRKKEQGPFGIPEKVFLESFAEHLSRALATFIKVSELVNEREIFGDALDQLHIGAILLDRSGCFIHANMAGSEILRARRLMLEDGLLVASEKELQPKFAAFITGGLSAYERRDSRHCEILMLRSEEGRMVQALVRPSLHHSPIGKMSAPAICVFVNLAEKHPAPSADVIREVFEFTRTESVIVSMLLTGLATKEIAQELGISLATVRTHMKSIFVKAGVGRQAELVSSVLRSVAFLA
jgi:DNA-binding CsgD family transcriptional regulator